MSEVSNLLLCQGVALMEAATIPAGNAPLSTRSSTAREDTFLRL